MTTTRALVVRCLDLLQRDQAAGTRMLGFAPTAPSLIWSAEDAAKLYTLAIRPMTVEELSDEQYGRALQLEPWILREGIEVLSAAAYLDTFDDAKLERYAASLADSVERWNRAWDAYLAKLAREAAEAAAKAERAERHARAQSQVAAAYRTWVQSGAKKDRERYLRLKEDFNKI